jgi:acyl carrier protein
MEIQEFIENFVTQFDEIDITEISAKTKFRDIEEWSSLMAFAIIAMIDEKYNVKIKGNDIRNSQTIGDLFNIVQSRA